MTPFHFSTNFPTLPQIPCVALLCLFAATTSTQAAEWVDGEISARFTGKVSDENDAEYVRGQGKGSYSFALGKPVQGGGDITLEATFRTHNVDVRLTGSQLYDLGPLSAAPQAVSVPKDENQPLPVQIGHYYLAVGRQCYTVIQTLDVEVSNRSTSFAGGADSASGRLTFRHLLPYDTLEKLNAALSGQQPPTSLSRPSPQSGSPPARTPETPARPVPASTEAGPLAAAYEQFQADSKAFLDLPTEQATVPKCDTLLDTAKNLTTRINDQIGEVDSTITGNGAKVSSLNERLAKITDLQLKDRTQTRISKIKEETERLQKELQEWTARLDELQKTEKKLREYRLIIGI